MEQEENVMKHLVQRVRHVYTTLNLYVLITIVFAVLQTTRFRSTFLAHVALLMLLGAFVLIPAGAVFIWRLNKYSRENHTRLQRLYLTTSRLVLALAWLVSSVPIVVLGGAAILQICATKTSTSTTPLVGGHKFIVKQTMTPGFLDPSIKRKLSIRWASGRTEKLPTTFNDAERYATNVLVAGGYVLIPAGRSLFYRPGTISSADGPWRMWKISSSQSLHAFLRQYAKENGDVGVTITSQADDLHLEQSPSVVVVDPSVTVTNEHIRYNTGGYFSSALRNREFYTPHLIESVDFATLKIVMKSNKSITSMPEYLVFSSTNAPNLTWVFNELETKTQNLQPSARPHGSAATGLTYGQP